jgi:tetratricopeptide (TPR) repeat protein
MTVKLSELEKLGRRIRDLRVERSMSQEELAEPDYTAAYISHIEHGKRRASQEALGHIAERLGMSLEQLVSGRDPQEDLRLEMAIQNAIALLHEGDTSRAEESLRETLARAQRAGAERAVSRAEDGLAQCLYKAGDLEGTLATYERIYSGLMEGPPEEATSSVVGISRCLHQLAKTHEAVDLLESHLARLNRSSAPDPTAQLQVYAALIGPCFDLGKVERAKEVAARGSDLAPEVADPDHLACLYQNRAGLLLEEQQPREALMFLARAEDMYKVLGWQAERARVRVARGLVNLEHDNLERAREAFSSVLDETEPLLVTPREKARALTGLARVERESGDPDEGLSLARKAFRLIGNEVPGEAAEAKREAGMSEAAMGNMDAALKLWRSALSLYKTADDKSEAARTARLVGKELERRGDHKAAAAVYREVLGGLEEVR